MSSLGYSPNPSARALRSNKTGLIALIVPEVVNPYFAAIAHGAQTVTRNAKLALVLCNSESEESIELDYLQTLERKHVDGVILTPPGPHPNPRADAEILRLSKRGMPLVCIGRRIRQDEVSMDIVTTDTGIGTREAMRHLLEGGHTRIAYIGGPTTTIAQTRLATYRSSLAARGLIVDDDLLFNSDLTLEGGYQTCHRILGLRKRPTAIFAVNDMVAIGVMIALQELGIAIPEEMSVVGFDDIPYASVFRPTLTTVAQPKYDLGRLAAERVIARIENRAAGHEIVSLPTHLVVRESTLHLRQAMKQNPVGAGA
jgi:LacI family transcriptional regulator, galactose operon repressor